MVLLLANKRDKETDQLIRQLTLNDIPTTRINSDFRIGNLDLDFATDQIHLYEHGKSDSPRYTLDRSIRAIWWRAEALRFHHAFGADTAILRTLQPRFDHDWQILTEAVQQLLADEALSIGNPFAERQNNKLNDLQLARKLGLQVPASLVTGNRERLRTFLATHPQVIFKHHGKRVNDRCEDRMICSGPTQLLARSGLADLPPFFNPTLFQEAVSKQLEIKVLYLFGTLYACAIFSQNHSETGTDFRNSSQTNRLRLSEIQLPETVSQPILRLVRSRSLQICTVDLILTPRQEYVFLEINPTGKFSWFTRHTNFPVYPHLIQQIKTRYEA